MSSSKLLHLLELYRSKNPLESKVQEMIQILLHDKKCFLRSNYSGHFTASAWILNTKRDKALMTHHKKLNIWLQLGGHADGNNNLLNVAQKEAKEESGFRKIRLIKDEIFDADIHTIPNYKNQPSHKHFDVRFIFEANEDEIIDFNHESYEVLWLKLEEIINYNSEVSIKRMVEKTLKDFV